MNNPKYLIIHHEAPSVPIETDRFDIVNEYHKSKGWGKIGYQYFIERSGEIKQGRADNEIGAHTIGFNDKSLGCCLAGNLDIQEVVPAQITTLTKWLKEKSAQYNIPPENIIPHRIAEQMYFGERRKSCYGSNLSDDWARNLIVQDKISIFKQLIKLYTALIELLKSRK